MAAFTLDRIILTSHFLEQPLPGLDALAGPDWTRNRPVPAGSDPMERMVSVYAPLAEWVRQTVAAGDRPVSIAGDCCSSLGVLAGLQAAGVYPFLIWFDAHGDFNTPETSPSGFLGGMPLAMLVGRGDQRLVRGLGLQLQPEDRVILSDARDLDTLEAEALRSSRVRHLAFVQDLLRNPLPEGPLYVHFDTDVVTPAEVPAQNYVATGGPSSRDVETVFRALAETGRIVAISVSTWNPELDRAGRSREVSMKLLKVLQESHPR
jgi:arginase